MKASEARKQWKDVLDRAAKGEVIQIERGGVIYWLKAMVNVLPPNDKWKPSTLETDEVSSNVRPNITKIKTVADATKQVKQIQATDGKDYSFCKNGHAIPEGRSKCMGKGCKYA